MKYLKALLWIYIFLFGTSIIQSCCKENVSVTEKCLYVKAWAVDSSGRKEISVVKGPFSFETVFDVLYSSNNRVSFISSAFAMSCSERYLNKVDETSLKLTLNGKFVFEGDTIPAGKNLLDITNSGIQRDSIRHGFINFNFTEAFFSRAKIVDGDYLFQVKGHTTDGISLSGEKWLSVDL